MRYSLLLLLGCTALMAQDVQDNEDYVPLTLSQNYLWTVHQMFNPARLAMIAAKAGIDHSSNDPVAWGQGAAGYAERVASRLGSMAIRENMAFGIRALDHEDPRYFRSTEKGFMKRAGYAVSRTFVARNASGGWMPAYSSLVSDVATPFIAQTWRPEAVTGRRAMRSAGMSVGFDAVSNLGSEFWPDIRKKFSRQ